MAPGILNEYTAITIKGSENFKRYGLKLRSQSAMCNPSIVIGGWALTNLSGRERHELGRERSISATVHFHSRFSPETLKSI